MPTVQKGLAWLAAGAALLALASIPVLGVASPLLLLFASYYLTAGPEVTSAAAVCAALGLTAVVVGRRAAPRAAVAGAIAAAVWLAVIGGLVASGTSPPFHDRYAGRLAHDLAAARSFRHTTTTANIRTLDRLKAFPGARRLYQSHNPEGERHYGGAYDRYGDELTGEAYVTWRATGWGTFREYSLPRRTSTDAVLAFYRGRLTGSRMQIREETHVDGLHVMDVAFWRDGRCVWLHLGTADPLYRPGRGYEVATDRSSSGDCLT